MFVYVLLVQGLGDNEYAYETVGVYSTRAKAETAMREFEFPAYIEEWEVK